MFYGVVCLILTIDIKLGELRHSKKLKSNSWISEDSSELELGRHYIIELDDGENIWELKTKAVKQRSEERKVY